MLEIIEDIKECDIKSIAITTDMWTSLANKGFITITCHIINQYFVHKNYVLDTLEMTEDHTGANIAIRI